jgi:hypothetical protein
MEKRNPQLYYTMIGQYRPQTDTEDEQMNHTTATTTSNPISNFPSTSTSDTSSTLPSSLSALILDNYDHAQQQSRRAQMSDLKQREQLDEKLEQKIKTKLQSTRSHRTSVHPLSQSERNLSDDESEIESESESEFEIESEPEYDNDDNDDNKYIPQTSQDEHALRESTSEYQQSMIEREETFLLAMQQRFLDGLDLDIDYNEIDSNILNDNLQIESRDAEEKYFND